MVNTVLHLRELLSIVIFLKLILKRVSFLQREAVNPVCIKASKLPQILFLLQYQVYFNAQTSKDTTHAHFIIENTGYWKPLYINNYMRAG